MEGRDGFSKFEEAALSLVDKYMKYPSHDMFHAKRVLANARFILSKINEEVNAHVVYAAAILHDLFDHKYDNEEAKEEALNLLKDFSFSNEEIDLFLSIVNSMSFSKGSPKPTSIELAIVRDADRLESIGAIGVARVFAYSGEKMRPIYSENGNSAIDHFYEKLLKVKDTLITEPAKNLAVKRHRFLIHFLNQFFDEMSELKRL